MSHGSASILDLITHLGPHTVAEFTGELSAAEKAGVDEYVRQHGGSHAAALGVRDVELALEIDTLMTVTA